MYNIDQVVRIEREIKMRLEAACGQDGWGISVAMAPPERKMLHIAA